MVYRSDQDIYQKVTEALRAELLEEGELTDDGILLLWMIRESGFIHEIFFGKRTGRNISENGAYGSIRSVDRCVVEAGIS